MSKSIYDPDTIEKDAFDMDNMKEEKASYLNASRTYTDCKIDKVENAAQQGLHVASEAKTIATSAQTAANTAQDTARSVQKKVDLIQPLAQQDWIDGTKQGTPLSHQPN
ncbi:hypothetical protein MNL09_02865 [Bartonella krasnovii]|nr:hypothetical protein MNL09_02865 [Bartonella krasnovii]